MTQVQLYDTTLRDGAQREGISFSVEDKLKIAKKLDELGIHFIEGGWPSSNPKDAEFFSRARGLELTHAALVPFGSTCRPYAEAADDLNLRALVAVGFSVVTIVGKSWDRQVTRVLETTVEENLRMVSDSIRYLKSQGLTVFFDAEHFFDGYKGNAQYALRIIEVAIEAGVDLVVLCDTNGGSLPQEVAAGVAAASGYGIPLGIHAHNDMDLAVANTLAAVDAGVVQVQGTINGYGERCGNANLCSIIPTLKLKLGSDCITAQQISKLTEVAYYVSEVANLPPDSHLPYVGSSAFGHKAGLHISGMAKDEGSYQHIDPEIVGNRGRVLVSELSGISAVVRKAKERGLELQPRGEQAKAILARVKDLESRGFQYDGAEASFELLLRRARPDYRPPFELVDFMVVVEKRRRPPTAGDEEGLLSEAMVKVKVGGQMMHIAAEGNGPVNALDVAMRKALLQYYPSLAAVKLMDYKVRILKESEGTASLVRVLIESSDGEHEWQTVGSSTNIIEASWIALADSLEYWLLRKAEASA